MGKVSARDIKRALSNYHSDPYDSTIFFEVKNGSTYFNSELLIMDGLAIKHSWVNPCLTGYEIKVSRSDFLQDDKWHGYLDYCHKFYFVCPKGMIKRKEIESMDNDVGLMYYSPDYKNCGLYTMKAPAYRNAGFPPKELLYYIIMSKLESDRYPFHSDKKEFFKEWLADKKDNIKLSFRIEEKLGDTIREQQREINRYHEEKEQLKKNKKKMNKFFDYLNNLGLKSYFGNGLKDNWKEKIGRLINSDFTEKDIRKIKNAINNAEKLKDLLPESDK